MLSFLLGGIVLAALLAALHLFQRASVKDIKTLLTWVAALGGLSLALMLTLTGRAGIAIGALTLFGPLIYQEFKGKRSGPSRSGAPPQPGIMTRQEAYEVLGLRPGATIGQIKEAHLRLMRAAHPDHGGSDWVASRINQARDILLG